MLTTQEHEILNNLHFQLKSHEIHITALKQIIIELMADPHKYKDLSMTAAQAFNSITDSIKRQNQTAAKVFNISDKSLPEQEH